MDLPSRAEYPEYYEVVKNPLSFSVIRQRLDEGKFYSLEEFFNGIHLVFQNAKDFNEPDSDISEDAVTMEEIFANVKRRCRLRLQSDIVKDPATFNPGIPHSSLMRQTLERILLTYDKKYRPLIIFNASPHHLWAALGVSNNPVLSPISRGRQLAELFLDLPSREVLPDYYKTIKEPISLNQITEKLRTDAYLGKLEGFLTDMHLLVDNAKKYNESTSQVYKDARHFEVTLSL